MKTHAPQADEATFDITPMIDIVFLLITFFMVVAAVITQKVEVDLPQAQEAVVPEEIKDRLELSLDAQGQLYMNLEAVTPEAVAQELIERRENPNFKVILRADADVEHARIQEVMSLCAENQVINLIFSTLQET